MSLPGAWDLGRSGVVHPLQLPRRGPGSRPWTKQAHAPRPKSSKPPSPPHPASDDSSRCAAAFFDDLQRREVPRRLLLRERGLGDRDQSRPSKEGCRGIGPATSAASSADSSSPRSNSTGLAADEDPDRADTFELDGVILAADANSSSAKIRPTLDLGETVVPAPTRRPRHYTNPRRRRRRDHGRCRA